MIKTLDANSNILSSTSLKSNFIVTGIIDESQSPPPVQSMDIGSMPVVVEVPANPAIATVQIVSSGRIIQQSLLSSQLLAGIVARIPDAEFKTPKCNHKDKDHKEHHAEKCRSQDNFVTRDRKILNELVLDVQRALNSKKCCGSHEAMEEIEELIERVERMTNANYVVENSFELSQSDVVTQLRAIAQGLKFPEPKHR